MSLTKEEHLLQKVSEESVEVSKEISKALLFGLSDKEPNQNLTNKEKIENELSDLFTVVQMLIKKGVLDRSEIFNVSKQDIKEAKVLKYLNYSIEKGITK